MHVTYRCVLRIVYEEDCHSTGGLNVAVQSKRLYCKRLWRSVSNAVNWIHIHEHMYMYTTLHCNGYSATNHGSVAYQVECHFLPLVESMESKLFDSVRYNTNHVLHQLLPPVKDTHYNLWQRSHCLTLPSEDNNLIRKLFSIGCYLGIFTSCLYGIIACHFHRFNVYVENFTSYVPLHLYVCWCLVCVCQT